ncbi:MAG: hypothetical protein JSV66_13460 [Trueperaceae bacterium]|nr:MAG: hypothetical protein JSV66_13460 [Trueperaceae bacterium]
MLYADRTLIDERHSRVRRAMERAGMMRGVMAALTGEEVRQAEETHGYLTMIWDRLARDLKPGRRRVPK